MVKATYWGHSSFLLESGPHRIVIDPFLQGNPLAPVKPEEVRCQWIAITHGHGDHVGDAIAIARRNEATLIANHEIATWAAGQGVKAHGMSTGGAFDFPFGRLKLTIAHHGSGLETAQGILYMGNPAGLLFQLAGKTIYHAGDTALTYDMKLLGEMHAIDLALLPIGDNYTMGVADAAKAVEFLRPKVVVPMHYDTFDVIRADAQDFAARVKATGCRVNVVPPGGSITV
jgi:L-ascorbate metabolism protein UlaG (beta-lactamase superfamily)